MATLILHLTYSLEAVHTCSNLVPFHHLWYIIWSLKIRFVINIRILRRFEGFQLSIVLDFYVLFKIHCLLTSFLATSCKFTICVHSFRYTAASFNIVTTPTRHILHGPVVIPHSVDAKFYNSSINTLHLLAEFPWLSLEDSNSFKFQTYYNLIYGNNDTDSSRSVYFSRFSVVMI